jgi:hypothetical protein
MPQLLQASIEFRFLSLHVHLFAENVLYIRQDGDSLVEPYSSDLFHLCYVILHLLSSDIREYLITFTPTSK